MQSGIDLAISHISYQFVIMVMIWKTLALKAGKTWDGLVTKLTYLTET